MKKKLQQTFYFFLNRVSFLILSYILLAHSSFAQCPQRYKDVVFSNLKISPNIIYGGNKLGPDGTRTWLAFDMYEPKDDTVQIRPTIMLIHGGSFTNWPPIDRRSPEIVEIAQDLAKRGFVVISPEYRLMSGSITYEKALYTCGAGFIDINELVCWLGNSVANGNPYRIDSTNFFMGGTSAGAIFCLNFAYFVHDTSDIKPDLRVGITRTAQLDGVNPQEILQNKFCGIKPKGLLLISGPLLDTNFIKPTSGAIYLVHGTADNTSPYYQGNFLLDPQFPMCYGPGVYIPILERNGIHVEADIYPGLDHTPVFINMFNLEQAILQFLQNLSIYNIPVLNNTKNHMADFCYRLMGSPISDCSLTGIKQNTFNGQLNIFPNPSSGEFNVKLPDVLRNKKIRIVVYNLSGQSIYDTEILGNESIPVNLSHQPKGTYVIGLSTLNKEEPVYYINKITLQ